MSYKDSHKGKEFAKSYDQNISNKFESRIYQIENEILLKYINHFFSDKDIDIMDFACGTWRITSLIFSEYKNVVGYDISVDMLNIAQKRHPKIQFYEKDIMKDVWINTKKFDCITSFRFFLNAEYDLKKNILLHLKKYLKNDWMIIFNIHMNKYSIPFLLSKMKYILWLTKIKQNWMSYAEVKKLVEENGFKIIDAKWYSFFLWNPLLTCLPFWLLKPLDSLLSKIGFLKYVSKDIIYIVKVNGERKKH